MAQTPTPTPGSRSRAIRQRKRHAAFRVRSDQRSWQSSLRDRGDGDRIGRTPLRTRRSPALLAGGNSLAAPRCLICLKLLTTINASPYRARASRPSAPLRNGIFLLMAQPPLLEKEGNGPVSQPPHSPRPIERNGCELLREGANHTIYVNRTKWKVSSVPSEKTAFLQIAFRNGCSTFFPMRHSRSVRNVVAVMLAAAFLCGVLEAQTDTASLTGLVADQ